MGGYNFLVLCVYDGVIVELVHCQPFDLVASSLILVAMDDCVSLSLCTCPATLSLSFAWHYVC